MSFTSSVLFVDCGFRQDLPRWQHLVSAHWLERVLAGEPVVAAPSADWQLFEVACDGQQSFFDGHIKGARYLDTRWFEQMPFWNKVPDADLLRVLQTFGIGPGTTVILYGRNMLAAARVAQLMLVAGVHDVRLLDGGMTAWCAAGNASHRGSHGVPAVAAAAVSPMDWKARSDYLINTSQARTLLESPGCALVSIRTRAEYLGETSGYSYIEARGEIAGAHWGHAGSEGDVNSMSNFQDALGRMKPASEIAALWRAEGIVPEMQIAFYCGTGWRASLAFFYAWLMGWEHISVYDGGWFEWSSDPANPVICRAAAVR
jgi:thiosulfate/3-mercaptopyruvate sulfurtransferase